MPHTPALFRNEGEDGSRLATSGSGEWGARRLCDEGSPNMPLYRFCRPEDLPMIVQALNACYDVHVPEQPATTVGQFREEMGLISLWPSNTMVVLEDAEPIAVIVGTKRPYGCWIAKLGVRSDHQRQGIGRYIVEALMRKLSIIGPRVISVDVPVDNAAALAFFLKLGFETWAQYWSFTGHPQAHAGDDLRQVHPVKPDVALSRYEILSPSAQCWERDAYTLQLYAGRLSGYAFWEEDNIHGYLLLHHQTIMDLALDPHADPIRVGTALLQRAAVDVKEAAAHRQGCRRKTRTRCPRAGRPHPTRVACAHGPAHHQTKWIRRFVRMSTLYEELRQVIEGEVRFDPYSRSLYSTDASMYQIEPIGVVIPTTRAMSSPRWTSPVATRSRCCHAAAAPAWPGRRWGMPW